MRKPEGRLIALEGVHGPELVRVGRQLLATAGCARSESGISVWDASGIFFELTQTKQKLGCPSAKTLLILYASDLAFRLRWEIEPALKEGRTVIAAPYVETAIAAGRSAGVPRSWITGLLRFAPSPDDQFRIKEKYTAAGWTPRRTGGFAEYFALGMKSISASNNPSDIRDRMLDYWKHDPRAADVRVLSDKVMAKIGKRGW